MDIGVRDADMFSTRNLSIDLLKQSKLPACLSTLSKPVSRYVSVNDAYLHLVERVWPEIEGNELLGKGAAIASPERDKRLWRLENKGFYDAEPAEIINATGKLLSVKICAQRLWCSGEACNLEFFHYELTSDIRLFTSFDSPRIGKPARFKHSIERQFSGMSVTEKEILMRRMLSLVVEGAVIAGKILNDEIVSAYSKELLERYRDFSTKKISKKTKIDFDFSSLTLDLFERHLLETAGEIWSLAVNCKNAAVVAELKSLIADYSLPKIMVVKS